MHGVAIILPILALCAVLPMTHAFQFPSFESISSLFGSLASEKEEAAETLERVKRQSGGDECGEKAFVSCSSKYVFNECLYFGSCNW